MAKQAILITAYHNLDQVGRIIEYFDLDFDFYIHIDKKCDEELPIELHRKNVRVYKEYKICWGSSAHLKAIMFLLGQSLRGNYLYYHLITGSDFPVKPLSEFKSFFSAENKHNYIEYHSLPRAGWDAEGGLARLKYYWIGNGTVDIRHNRFIYQGIRIQRKLKICRCFLKTFKKLYGGGTYWSLHADCAKYLFDFYVEHRIKYSVNFTHCAEEIVPHTIILNAAPEFAIINDSLRFMRWTDGKSSPEILDGNDFLDIKNSNSFFARKFDKSISSKLLEKLCRQ